MSWTQRISGLPLIIGELSVGCPLTQDHEAGIALVSGMSTLRLSIEFRDFTVYITASDEMFSTEPALRHANDWFVERDPDIPINPHKLMCHLHRIAKLDFVNIRVRIHWKELLRRRDFKRMSDLLSDFTHFQLNPTGDGCACWSGRNHRRSIL